MFKEKDRNMCLLEPSNIVFSEEWIPQQAKTNSHSIQISNVET